MMEKMNDVLVKGGGIIPEKDSEALAALGVGKLFTPGTPTAIIVEYINNWAYENRNF